MATAREETAVSDQNKAAQAKASMQKQKSHIVLSPIIKENEASAHRMIPIQKSLNSI
jgi:hypothetical protein